MTEIISKSYSLERYRSSSSSFSSSASSSPPLNSAARMQNGGYPPMLPPAMGHYTPYVQIPPPPTQPLPPANRAENMSANSLQTPFVFENGRRYHGYRAGLYMYPNDDKEQDRLDIFHKMYLVSRQNELHRAPITPNGQPIRILDLGTGTGIWSIDMADQYPHAEVVGVDLSPMQPKWIPSNMTIKMADFESEWTLGQSSFDLIHLRNGCGSISDWTNLYRRALQHLKPSYGWIEQVEIDYEPRCDDGTLAPNSYISQWYDYLSDATARVGKPIQYQHNTGAMLHAAGFIHIREVVVQIPYSPWAADPHAKKIGSWYTLAMSEGLDSLCCGPFSRVLKWTNDDIKRMLIPVKKEMLNKRIHAYNNMHIWIARRP